MAYKVTKKGKLYAVVKDDTYYDGDWYVVDVTSGTKLKHCWTAADAKWYLESLEDGYSTPESFNTSWNSDYGKPIDMPASLKKMQQQLLNPKPKKQASQKPIGSTSTSIVDVTNNGTHYILKMDDGTFGVLVPSTGESKMGLKTLGGAKTSAKSMLKKMAGQKLGEMGVDAGSDAVDTLIKVYEDRVRDMYGQAAREMAKKQAAYMEQFQEQNAQMAQSLADGKITMGEYQSWLRTQGIGQSWYRDMVESLSNDLVSADEKAMDMLNGYVPKAYAENMNFSTYQIEGDTSIKTGFSLYNESTVARLISNPEGSLLPDLPQPKVDKLKDKAWSKQKISSCVTQSILQGESVPDAAKRLMGVVGMSANSAMRAARTTLTGAQNLGRLDAGRRAKQMGIQLKKQWIATVDARTRYSHRELDRETVEIEESFSNGCICPADPNGEPHEVYNCRCAMRYVLPNHEYDDLPDKTKEGVAYDEWKNEHMTKLEAQKEKLQQKLADFQAQEAQIKATMPQNKTYSGIWKGDVTLNDYEAKKGAIPAKEDYYLQQIANAPNTPYGESQVAQAKKHLKDLYDFQTSGEQYAAAKDAIGAQLGAIQDKKKSITKKLTKIGINDAYSDERKTNALRWSSKAKADQILRHYTSDAWIAATRDEQLGIYGYTAGSGMFNRPLSGFEGGWGSYNYVGPKKVDLDYEGSKKKIQDMTRFIERSAFEEDVWLRRGCGNEAMESFFGLDFGAMIRMSDTEIEALTGTSNRIMGFLSCGTASESGAGFGGNVDMRIYVPAGTQAVYAEPFSAYSGASYNGKNWDGKKSQGTSDWDFGGEDETIIQRGASYTCTKIERRGYGFYVEMEVHPEDGYDTFGQED